jgi:hypothetical protein
VLAEASLNPEMAHLVEAIGAAEAMPIAEPMASA